LKPLADRVDAADLYLSIISVEELEIGVQLANRRDATQGHALRNWLDNQVLPAFKSRILNIDLAVVKRSASLHVPNPKPIRNGLIAATAMVHGKTLVTRNIRDFEGFGVSLLNPRD
jgi:toxin FitB